MKLRATVRQATGYTTHWQGCIKNGVVVKGDQFPTPAFVELDPQSDGTCFLLYLNARGEYQTDTWHQTLEDAKEQAKLEFAIEANEWKQVTDDGRIE